MAGGHGDPNQDRKIRSGFRKGPRSNASQMLYRCANLATYAESGGTGVRSIYILNRKVSC
jgi:hypothetical protein